MKRIFVLLALLLFFAGCSQSVKYVCSDGSVVNDASKCPPPEIKNSISEPQVSPTNVFTLKSGESTNFDDKTVKLLDVFDDGRTVFDVSGITLEIGSTKYLEVINGLGITVTAISYNFTNPDMSSATFKIDKLLLNQSEYLFFDDEPQIIDSVSVILRGITSSYIIVDTDDVLGMKIYQGSSKVVSGLNITDVRNFPHGIRAEDYAILGIVKV